MVIPEMFQARHRAVRAAALAAPLFVACGLAEAGDLKNIVSDLYGGDGITLRDVGGPFSHTAHFTALSLLELQNLNNALTSGLGTFAFNSTVTSFTFDIERGVPVRSTESLGPLLGERASTLGKNKLDIAVTYTRIDFSKFNGTPLDSLQVIFNHDDVNHDGVLGSTPTFPPDFELDQIRVDLNLEITQDVYAAYLNYGLTRRWDIGAVVPIIHSEARATANATVVSNAVLSPGLHVFDPVNQDSPMSQVQGSDTSIGDVLLRSKYNFLRGDEDWPDLAVRGQVGLPTGDADNLSGTGGTSVQGMLIASQRFDWLTPHGNLAYEFAGGSAEDNLRYVAGFDARVDEDVTLACDVLGRWVPEGDGVGDHLIDLAIGAKANLFQSFPAFFNLIFPLNDQGVRADIIWTIGVERAF